MDFSLDVIGYSCVIFLGIVMMGGVLCIELKIGNMTQGKVAIGTTVVILVHAVLAGLVVIGVIGHNPYPKKQEHNQALERQAEWEKNAALVTEEIEKVCEKIARLEDAGADISENLNDFKSENCSK